MELAKFREKVFDRAKAEGFTDMELYHNSADRLQLRVFGGEVDSYTLSQEGGWSFRGVYNGKVGYSYTEVADEDSVEMLVRDSRENAQVIDSDEVIEIFAGSDKYPEFEGVSAALAAVEPEEKIEFAKALEAAALAADPRVKAANMCIFASADDTVNIQNSKGLDLSYRHNGAYFYISVMVQEGQDTKTFGRFESTRDLKQADPAAVAGKAVKEALGLLGADTMDSGSYPVVLRWEAATTLLGAFSGVFSAENVQKNMSLLKGKLGEQVAAAAVTIVDDPLLPAGLYSSPFDAEGVATKTKTVVDSGKLATYLHNLKTAAKDGVESTGNASKASYNSSVAVAPSNMFIQAGEEGLEEMIAGIDRGVVVVDVQGAHSGANPVSGDFSLGAFGYLVENGKVVRPVNQITIAGNFLEMLQDVQKVGNDLNFGMPMGSLIGSPSLLIGDLSVSGK